MAIMKLVVAPDPLLKQKSKEIEKVDDSIRKLMDDMYETMIHHEGIGLAAVQVGVLKSIIVIELGESHDMDGPLYIANPKIISNRLSPLHANNPSASIQNSSQGKDGAHVHRSPVLRQCHA